MKTILRKATVAFVAMLASANVMAQSFELKKEFDRDFFSDFEFVAANFTKDGNPRMLVKEGGEENLYVNGHDVYKAILNKLSVLNSNLEVEKEFTSGPLFEEYADVTVEYAAKTLKVDSVVKSRYNDINDFYRYFRFDTVEVEVYYDENDTLYYESYISYDYEEAVANLPEEVLKPYLEKYAKEHLAEDYYATTTFNGYMVYVEGYHDFEESEYFDWSVQYPCEGLIYKAYNDIEYVEFYYSPDELVEINRYESKVVSAYFVDYAFLRELCYVSDCAATISQTLFNDDEEYEFILPVMGLITESDYSEHEHIQRTYYRYKTIGYKIVSEDGTVLQEIIVNETKDSSINIEAYIVQFGDKTYFVIETYGGESGKDNDMTYFYEINKNTNSIQKVREMQGSMRVNPIVADRNEEITISIDDDNNNVARELIITGVNGKLIERRTIPAGENTFKVNAGMMRSGMYNFTLQKKGNVVDNSKVIVK